MNHAVVTENLADYLEGDLALDLRALVDAHLDGCSTCATEVREMQQTIRLLQALPEPEPPAMIAANVMRRIRAGETQPSLFQRIERGLGSILEPSFVLPSAAMAIAAIAIFVIQGREPVAVVTGTDPEPAARRAGESLAANSAASAIGLSSQEEERSFGASAAREAVISPVAPQSVVARSPVPAPARDSVEPGRPDSAREVVRVDATLAARNPSERLDGRSATSASEPVEMQGAAGRAARSPWDERQRVAIAAAPARPGAGGSIFGAPVLAQGFAPSSPTAASNRGSGALSNTVSTAVPTALSRPVAGEARRVTGKNSGSRIEDSGGEDPRDAWLARALEDPVDFAHYIARPNLAEQELWVARLAERANARGLLDEVIDALRNAGDEKAGWLAEDFSAAAESGRSSEVGLDR